MNHFNLFCLFQEHGSFSWDSNAETLLILAKLNHAKCFVELCSFVLCQLKLREVSIFSYYSHQEGKMIRTACLNQQTS